MSGADDGGLHFEVARLRAWALGGGLDEAMWDDYEEWSAIFAAFRRFVQLKPPAQWDAEESRDVLYAIAGDFEDGVLVDQLVERHPDVLIEIAARARHDGEIDARLQLAEALGRVDVDREACEALLLDYYDDDEEVVRRYALNALGAMRSRHTERIALEEWDRVHADQTAAERGVRASRIAAVLHALHRVQAPSFERLLTAAEADQSARVSDHAAHMRQWVADGGEGDMPWFCPSDAALREEDEEWREKGLPPLPRRLHREPPSRLETLLRRLSIRRQKRRAPTSSE